jgi:hypothetical protein
MNTRGAFFAGQTGAIFLKRLRRREKKVIVNNIMTG